MLKKKVKPAFVFIYTLFCRLNYKTKGCFYGPLRRNLKNTDYSFAMEIMNWNSDNMSLCLKQIRYKN